MSSCSFFLGYTAVAVLLAAAGAELVSWAILSVHPLPRQADPESQKTSPVYAETDWARDFWREEFSRRMKPAVYVPFRLWGVTEWHGKYINNDPGITGFLRRTVNPANCDSPHRITVWTFGGSTMYGTAVPDWATIPSYLSRVMNTQSQEQCVVVLNLGVEGYVTDQELILLGEHLKAGGRPDIVIFYDGVNDSSLAWPPHGSRNAHFLFRTIKTRVEGSVSGRLDFLQKSYVVRLVQDIMVRLQPAHSFASLIAQAQPKVMAVVDNYEANLRLASALSAAYNFRLYCFWQPMLIYGHKPLVPFEQQMAARETTGTSAESAWFLTMVAAYREAEHRTAQNGNFVFLANLFDATPQPIYVDEAHLGPLGNELVAQAIAGYIKGHPVNN